MTKKELKELRRMEKQERERTGNTGGGSSDLTKWLILGIGGALFLAAFSFIIFSIKQSKNKPVILSSVGYERGEKNAKVTLVEFGDLQCPACKAYEPIVEKTLSDFKGRVKLVYKHFPLTSVHPNALLAAKVSVAAGNQGKFWEMHDWLYENQEQWAGLTGADAKSKMLEEAKKLKLEMDKLNKDINDKKTEDLISSTQTEGIDLGVASTPTFYVNNKKMDPQPSDYDAFKKVIETAIKDAK